MYNECGELAIFMVCGRSTANYERERRPNYTSTNTKVSDNAQLQNNCQHR